MFAEAATFNCGGDKSGRAVFGCLPESEAGRSSGQRAQGPRGVGHRTAHERLKTSADRGVKIGKGFRVCSG
eukprot:10785423-Karenia_brevis.AAC.1